MKAIKTPPQEPTSDSSISYSDVLNWLVESTQGLMNPIPNSLTNAFAAATNPLIDEIRERIGTNVNPYGYDIQPFDRLYNAIVKNEPEESSLGADPYRGSELSNRTPENQERIDLLQMYLGLPQEFNSIDKSRYTPSEESIFSGYNDGRDLYRSKATEERLIYTIQRELANSRLDEFLEKSSNKAAYYDDFGNVLGNFRLGGGSDERGSYVEYGDVWDLNPVSGYLIGKDQMEGKESTQLDRIRNSAITAIEDISGKMLGTSPSTIYGRVYYDPETRSVIRH